jgi:hypothetical protein
MGKRRRREEKWERKKNREYLDNQTKENDNIKLTRTGNI